MSYPARSGGPCVAQGSCLRAEKQAPADRNPAGRQSKEVPAHSAMLLDQLGAGPGWSAIELGCGQEVTLLSASENPGIGKPWQYEER